MKARALVLIAFAASILAALYAALGPTYESCDTAGACRHRSTVAVNGWWVLIVVAVPVVVASIPVVFDRRATRIVSTALLWAFSVIAGFSVGLFFVPAAIVMTIAAARSDPVPVSAA